MTLASIDRYLRRCDTFLAIALRALAPSRGDRYSWSVAKRCVDLAIGVPSAMIGLPVAFGLAIANQGAHPLLPAFFVQERAGQGSPIKIVKVRTMLPRAPDS